MSSSAQDLYRYSLLGVDVFSCRSDEACGLVARRIQTRVPTRVGFLNANLALCAAQDERLRDRLGDFLLFNDGIGVEIANRALNHAGFVENLNGTDLVPALLGGRARPLSIFLLGSRPERIEHVARAFERRWPRHRIVGYAHGFLGPAEEETLTKQIQDLGPDLVLVGTGNPRQELWIARNIPRCAPCGIGVGGLFDFVVGAVPRAPDWVRALRCEWLFRLAVEPRRLWRRYLIGNTVFLAHVLRAWSVGRRGGRENNGRRIDEPAIPRIESRRAPSLSPARTGSEAQDEQTGSAFQANRRL